MFVGSGLYGAVFAQKTSEVEMSMLVIDNRRHLICTHLTKCGGVVMPEDAAAKTKSSVKKLPDVANKNITWHSSVDQVAKVLNNDKITVVGVGTAVLKN